MKTFKPAWAVALAVVSLTAALPLTTQAQAFKCRQANGSTAFQDHPCSDGASGAAMNLPTPASGRGAPPSAGAPSAAGKPGRAPRGVPGQDSGQDAAIQRANEEINARNAQNEAYNRNLRCNYARQQLEVAKDGRNIFRRDNKGDRQYVEDKDRAAVVASKQREVTRECR